MLLLCVCGGGGGAETEVMHAACNGQQQTNAIFRWSLCCCTLLWTCGIDLSEVWVLCWMNVDLWVMVFVSPEVTPSAWQHISIQWVRNLLSGSQQSTFLESCGVADLVTTCYGGRNRRVSEAFVRTGKVGYSSNLACEKCVCVCVFMMMIAFI